ncbi:zinc-binding alcohol dehydrogenase family protein [Bradyrhizobium sp. dw_78]|uniref:zinc-binding alcohol dehydrogenase family protein n=1 Tax=Bradyrhizobium sp. dw_78 TaxID=2719793 RepID=UPI001BD4C009|nr:zinc-binding alcohol dehydrogenase family protein [Bradyrhizobium sp. dw_78]
MKAVAYRQSQKIDHSESLIDVELEAPAPGPRDLLVEVKAISVNPVDVKVRERVDPKGEDKVLGWDVAGVVYGLGTGASRFKIGQEVFYAGTINRQGANAELHVVDERIVGRKPASLDFAAAAAMPLTSLTAWELLFDRFAAPYGKSGEPGFLLIVGGAGGVGSMAIQLARRLTTLTVIATASRPETHDWVRNMGAHHVVDHTKPLVDQVRPLAPQGVAYIMGLTHTEQHFDEIAELIAPEGHLGLIDDPATPPDVTRLKGKSAALHWESMFTRSLYQPASSGRQGRILDEVADLVDAGVLRTTFKENFGKINAANLQKAHAMIESAQSIGKIVLSGF